MFLTAKLLMVNVLYGKSRIALSLLCDPECLSVPQLRLLCDIDNYPCHPHS